MDTPTGRQLSALLVAFATTALVACGSPGGDGAAPGDTAQAAGGASGSASGGQPAMVVPSGTSITVRLNTTVSTSDNSAGDPFTATVTEAVTVDGRTAIPSGATVHGKVGKAGIVRTEDGQERNLIALTPETIEVGGERRAIEAEITGMDIQERDERLTGGDAAIIGGSTAGGAILGAIVGDEAGAIIGGMAGMATSTAIIVAGKDTELRVSEGTTMQLQLRESLRVR